MSDYPTREELEEIEKWDYNDWDGLMAFIEPLFSPMGRVWQEQGVTYMATGGWSGNEDIILAMQSNAMIWAMYAHSWFRGGLYGFSGSHDNPTVPDLNADLEVMKENVVALKMERDEARLLVRELVDNEPESVQFSFARWRAIGLIDRWETAFA